MSGHVLEPAAQELADATSNMTAALAVLARRRGDVRAATTQAVEVLKAALKSGKEKS
jgi:hypothetical protein